jgi:hypothetical protein
MGRIDWMLIAELPEALKDGREVLLWEPEEDGAGSAVVGKFADEHWFCACYDYQQVWSPTHFAEINPPAS